MFSKLSNSLADTLEGGDVALGLLDNTYSPTLVKFCGELGLDFVWLDTEHGGLDPWTATAMEDLLRATGRTDIELLVRVPDTDPTLVRTALELGLRNVFLPRVETARSAALEADVPVGGLGFGMDDVNEKAADGYQILNLGSTTGALKQTVDGWFDAYDGVRPTGE